MTPKFPTDIEIAQAAKPRPITEIAAEAGLGPDEYLPYGRFKAKITPEAAAARPPKGRLVLVTGINPTPAGEGKSTVTVGLAQAFRRLGKKVMVCIREPSLGPVFGVKGGAAGGGYAQVIPMDEINLHFTGDFHAITSAHNLLSALLDNHLHQGNALGLDVRRILWPRTIDMNDRALRHIVVGLGGLNGGPTREERFVIVPGSEIMAILCLASSLADLEQRICPDHRRPHPRQEARHRRRPEGRGRHDAAPPDALLPNLVQTLEGGPALVHGGPFGNIAHGCNSVVATRLGARHGRPRPHRGRLRRRPRRGEVLRHQVPDGRAQPRSGGGRGHHPRAQDARRRQEGRARHPERGGAQGGHGQPRGTRPERAEVRRAGGAWPSTGSSSDTPEEIEAVHRGAPSRGAPGWP